MTDDVIGAETPDMQALAAIVLFLDDIAQADDDDMANDIAADGVDVRVGNAGGP